MVSPWEHRHFPMGTSAVEFSPVPRLEEASWAGGPSWRSATLAPRPAEKRGELSLC